MSVKGPNSWPNTLPSHLLGRHFTDHMQRTGPDIVNSMDQAACRELIEGSAEIWECGGGTKGACHEEQVTIDFAFATCVTIAPVKKGEAFTEAPPWTLDDVFPETDARTPVIFILSTTTVPSSRIPSAASPGLRFVLTTRNTASSFCSLANAASSASAGWCACGPSA